MYRFIISLILICIINGEYEPTPPQNGCALNGCLFPFNNTSTYVFNLWGNSHQRGISHGLLLATQIIDFIEFYMIRTLCNDNINEYELFYNWVKHNITFPDEFNDEIDGIILGMKQSNKSLIIPSLNRKVTNIDIKTINSYLEKTASVPGPFLYGKGGCTQFLAIYNFSENGHLLTARNMDGETDEWKVTVTHLIIFAIDDPRYPKVVSFLWPGFVGALSSINEDGTYVMMNTGNMGNSAPITGITPISIQARSIVNNFVKKNYSSTNIQEYILNTFKSNTTSNIGTSGGGAILMIGNDIGKENGNELSPIFALELDRLNVIVRNPMDSIDLDIPNTIMASNHFRKLGVNTSYVINSNESYSVYNLDVRTGYYNSSWRYEVGRERVYAFNRIYGKLNINRMINILQSVSHGSTEHSIITQNDGNNIHIWFAVANKDDTLWDAPYMVWNKFKFHDIFNQSHIYRHIY